VYWQGRAERAAGLLTEKGTADFAALAGRRQYYGFLAASQLGVVPQLNARSLPDDPAVSAAARAAPGMRRVLELYAIGDRTNARREWRFLHTRLDAPVRAAAVAELAATGWTDLAVITTSDPIFADYLALRFPAPHRTAFDAASKANSLPLAYLYGVSRQESAFGAAAVSPVGALGLMQLMPATAELTARRLGMSAPTRGDLLQPAVNVKLGARHLAMLVKRYGGNRFLAAAAYNAGEGRVDRWLAERPLVAADTWIDTIPFLETRNYVKAVMSFGYIYGQLLDAPIPFMTPAELGGPRTAEIARTP
jgi:soluble lytic murein transglycosylase